MPAAGQCCMLTHYLTHLLSSRRILGTFMAAAMLLAPMQAERPACRGVGTGLWSQIWT